MPGNTPARRPATVRTPVLWLAAGLAAGTAAAQPTSVVNSPHNLSAGGPGAIRAAAEDQVCVFCHAPHNSTPVRPLWNRAMPTEAYTIYTSRALEAQPGQPTGTSKMCLSCHDGTIALGSVSSSGTPIVMSGGVITMPQGAGHIGTDLSDDHPISFPFDGPLANRTPHLRDPATLPPAVRLDPNSELQCTSCHDAHNNSMGKFLVMRNETSQLCSSCHTMGTTTLAAHGECSACHQPHAAPSGPYLLRARNATQACLACHDGMHQGAADIASDLRKLSAHETDSPVDPAGAPSSHSACTDCHDPHTMGSGRADAAPRIHPNLGRARGVSISGVAIAPATNEFEVCFRCHAETSKVQAVVSRVLPQTNARLEFHPGAVSFHPVTTAGRNSDVPSLKPGWTTASLVYCSDCHASDSGTTGSGPGGTHGSSSVPLLVANYTTADNAVESEFAYGLCYTCHERTSILGDRSFPEHRRHIVDVRTSCSTCHDSHGIAAGQGTARNNAHLINFDSTVVRPVPGAGLEYVSTIAGGNCTLTCHGTSHVGTSYTK